MSVVPPVLHRSARAITPHEFLEALQATCAPRFPHARGRTHRPIGTLSSTQEMEGRGCEAVIV